jgi:SH3-like domain-containing protein
MLKRPRNHNFHHSPWNIRLLRALLGPLFCLALLPAAIGASAAGAGPSGLPLPRYVSLKSERVNMRIGPGRNYPVQWMYVKRGLPMEVIQEYDNWRKVRDPQGNEGWILHSLLSGERTAIIAPWQEKGGAIEMHAAPLTGAAVSARIEPGVIASVAACGSGWCRLRTAGVSGYVSQKLLWGVYPGEEF